MGLGSARSASTLERYLPVLSWLPAYDRRWLRADVLAGLTAWAVLLPQALAYAQIAGLPAQAALVSEASPPVRVVFLDLEATSNLDIEGVDALGELREELEQGGAELWLARVRAPVRGLLERAGLSQRIGEERIFPSVRAGAQVYLGVVKRG